jgi:hypothetical protein
MKAQEPELNAIYPAKNPLKRLEAVPETIPTFDKEQVFVRDAAIGGIQ